MSEELYVIVMLRDQQPVVIPADAETARTAVRASAAAINGRTSFKVGESASFSGADVVSVYVSKEKAAPAMSSESLFDAVFGKRR